MPQDAIPTAFPDHKTAVAHFAGSYVLRLTELYIRLSGDDSPIHRDTEYQRFFGDHPEFSASLKDIPRHFIIPGKLVEGVTVGLFRRQFRSAGSDAENGFLLGSSKCANLCPVYYGETVQYDIRTLEKTGRVSRGGYHEYALSGEAHKEVGGRRIDVLRFELTGALHGSFQQPNLTQETS